MGPTVDMHQGAAVTDAAHDSGVDEHFLAARLQRAALQRRDQVADVEVDDVVQLVRRAVQQRRRTRKLAARGVILHLQSS